MKALGKWLLVAVFAVIVGVAWSSPYYLAKGKDAVFNWVNEQRQALQDRRDFPAYAACVNGSTEYATVLNVRRDAPHHGIVIHWVLHYQAVPERASIQRAVEISEENLNRVSDVWEAMTRCADNIRDWNALAFFQVSLGVAGTIDDGKTHLYAATVNLVLLNRPAVAAVAGSDKPLEVLVAGMEGKLPGVAVMAIDVRAAKAYLIHSNTGALKLALEREDASGR